MSKIIQKFDSKGEFILQDFEKVFFDALKKQIKKDFTRSACELPLANCLKSIQLYEEIYDKILWLSNNDFKKILDILYAIDVSEKKIKQSLKNNLEDSIDKISVLILQRECQKVWYRNYYNKLKP